MSEKDLRGFVGDRRANPFSAFNETEYQLLIAIIGEAAEESACRAAQKTAELVGNACCAHIDRTSSLEAVVFGRAERGIVGIDQRMAESERDRKDIRGEMKAMADDRVWFRRMVYSAIFIGVVGLAISLIQFALIGR